MIDREFEQVSEEHMKSMTKPEGPAREAAKALFDVLDQYIIEFNTIEPQMNEAAIPVICAAMDAYARQQTAAKDAEIAELKRDIESDFMQGTYARLKALQTAERELASLRQSFESEAERRFEYFCEHRMRAAERERDSLREVANRVQEAWASRQVNYEHEVVTLDFGAAQLIEDTLAALKPGKESHE